MKNLITKLIKITLGLLGVAMVDSCIAKAEYGCPHADFEAKGVVTDEDVDGQENGGEFHKVAVEVPVFKVKEGDGNWYDGAYEAGANVTMHKK